MMTPFYGALTQNVFVRLSSVQCAKQCQRFSIFRHVMIFLYNILYKFLVKSIIFKFVVVVVEPMTRRSTLKS